MNVSEYIMERIAQEGVEKVFMVSGGGGMFLIEALGNNPKLQHVCNHHSQEGIKQTEKGCLDCFCAAVWELLFRNRCMAFWKIPLRKHDSHILCQKNLPLFSFLSVLPRKAEMMVQRNGPDKEFCPFPCSV